MTRVDCTYKKNGNKIDISLLYYVFVKRVVFNRFKLLLRINRNSKKID